MDRGQGPQVCFRSQSPAKPSPHALFSAQLRQAARDLATWGRQLIQAGREQPGGTASRRVPLLLGVLPGASMWD